MIGANANVKSSDENAESASTEEFLPHKHWKKGLICGIPHPKGVLIHGHAGLWVL